MIVYRAQKQPVHTEAVLSRLKSLLHRMSRHGVTDHSQVVEMLIDYGEWESAAVDALCPDEDVESSPVRALRQTSLLIGRMFCLSWENKNGEAKVLAGRALQDAERLSSFDWPALVHAGVSEGYAYYGLYPETYMEAARRFFRDCRPRHVVGIGLRSIGTSLSAVVCAALSGLGCTVESYTVRPHGHPFDRRLNLSPALKDRWRTLDDAYFLIIDEGPGLSGSSLCGTAQELSELGIADDRILFFPSWEPDGSGFVSQMARARWGRHRKYTASFEEVWVQSGRLARSLPFAGAMDVSAGRWRSLFWDNPSDFPAVHPHHERRKYLSMESLSSTEPLHRLMSPPRQSDAASLSSMVLMKFAGLGRYGQQAYVRAVRLAETGFAPPVLGLADGFLVTRFIAGRPLREKDGDPDFLDFAARYMAHVKEAFPAPKRLSCVDLIEMMRVNVLEGLGEPWVERLHPLEAWFRADCDESSGIAMDGRMMPHEWLRTAQGYLKTDGVDHHADHFFPGPQDMAWDLAGCGIEFSLDEARQAHLIRHYEACSGDTNVQERLRFYKAAYLASRLGYAHLAAGTLGDSPDGKRFKMLTARYESMLRHELSCRQ